MQRLLALPSALLTPIAVAGILTLTPLRAWGQSIYSPISLPQSGEVTDRLSAQDIPTGFGGHARDYTITLEAGDQIVIDLTSEEFDTVVSLIDSNGNTVGENDDGPDGTTNSLLFARIVTPGQYTVRVRAFAGQGLGQFFLRVARLQPAN